MKNFKQTFRNGCSVNHWCLVRVKEMDMCNERQLKIALCALVLHHIHKRLAYKRFDDITIKCPKLMNLYASLSPELAKSIESDEDTLRGCLAYDDFSRRFVRDSNNGTVVQEQNCFAQPGQAMQILKMTH
jgi:hypothetical protein